MEMEIDEDLLAQGLSEKQVSQKDIRVGEKIKILREQRGLSLQDISKKTGFSSAVLSQMENHLISPPLGALIKLAEAFDVKIGYFFGEASGQRFAIVRRDERKVVSRFASKEGINYGYSYESLGSAMTGRHMEPFIVTLTKATVGHGELSTHHGEEFIFVLDGDMEVTLSDHSDILKAGDCIYYDSTIPHKVSAHSADETKILAVIFTG